MSMHIEAINNKVSHVNKDKLIEYMKNNWDVSLKKSTLKEEVVAEFLKHINGENAISVVDYFKEDICYTSYETKSILKITNYKLNKMIQANELSIVSSYPNERGSKSRGDVCRLFSITQVQNILQGK